MEVLDYRPSQLDLIPKAVFVEGKNDFYTLNYFKDIIFKKFKQLSIIPGTSASNLETVISLYLGWGSKFVILLDSDKEGLKQKSRYEEQYGISLENLIFTLKKIDSTWTNKDLEDLINNKDKQQIVETVYGVGTKMTKTNFNRSIQELYIKNQVVKFEKDTLDNFKTILETLNTKLKI